MAGIGEGEDENTASMVEAGAGSFGVELRRVWSLAISRNDVNADIGGEGKADAAGEGRQDERPSRSWLPPGLRCLIA